MGPPQNKRIRILVTEDRPNTADLLRRARLSGEQIGERAVVVDDQDGGLVGRLPRRCSLGHQSSHEAPLTRYDYTLRQNSS